MQTIVKRALIALLFVAVAPVASAAPAGFPLATITRAPDMRERMVLHGNTRPEANARNDQGMLADDTALPNLLLQLKRSDERETALKQYIVDLQNPGSANYHKWLTPDQFAAHYGVASSDVAVVTSWLVSHGFTINGVTPSGLNIDFSGTTGQIREAFGTEIHRLNVDGKSHIANMSDPQIPAALASVVAGVVSLHDFHPKPHLQHRLSNPAYTYAGSTGTFHALTAGDIATIYNLKPLFAAGITGLGQTIMVVEDTYVYSTDDWTIFRKTFGLARPYPHGTLTQVSPTGAIACANPGYQGKGTPGYGDDGEATLDIEWATAAAPNAAIVLAACTDTATVFGGLIALQNTLNGPAATLPSVVSISYGEAEAVNGAAANLSYYNAYQQAVSQGVSIFVSSGDELAASDDNGSVARHGIGISGFASTPYNVAVGGTDFGYTPDHVDPATYWSPTNSNTYASALSYIQEVPWNDSCAQGITAALFGMTPLAFCASSTASSDNLLNAIGGSGGPSGCATGTASVRGVVSGTCAGYPKPNWQTVVGNPNDGVRDIPDVALFASNGFWDAYYVTCWSNPDTSATVGGGFTCTGAPSTWAGFGGTSVSSPIMAGIQALVNQGTGSRWGNPNVNYYYMARQQYGLNGSSTCNSTTVNKTSNGCVFYDITEGDINAPCRINGSTLYNCYRPSGTYGLLSTSNSTLQVAYPTTTGWDFATGIGSVNAYNLVMGWASPPPQ